MTTYKIEPGRCYYEKRVGLHWEVWYCRDDSSVDLASGAREWRASSVKYWRWINAARTASEMWGAFNDGVWIANCRTADANNAEASLTVSSTPRATGEG